MANTKSAIKRIATTRRESEANRVHVASMRTAIKHLENAVATGADNVEELYTTAVKAVDRTAQRGLIHKNKAARTKSQLARLVK